MIAKIGQTLSIGLLNEHNARKFEFNIAKWRAQWPDATAINVIVQRHGDKNAYPAISSMDGDTIIWTVTRFDTERAGVGKMWVAFTAGENLLGMTPETAFTVQGGPEMIDGDTPASDTPPWIQQVLDAVEGWVPGEGGGGSGKPGKDGEDGATFTPSVSADGVISWTNDKELENPKPVDITGPEGKPGEKGDPGGVLTQYLHNADFLQFVAQPGINQKHANSAETYAGDRWVLSSGTLTADANESGNGYSNVKLNGTITQKVELLPANGFVGVSVLSGEAGIVYADGVVTITGANAVLDRAWLTDVESDIPPARRGYSAELMECYRYYIYFAKTDKLTYAGFAQSETEARFTIPLPVPMRIESPTQRIQYRSTMQMYPGAVTPEAINSVTVIGNTASLSLKSSGLTKGTVMALKTNATIELCADL